MVKTNPSLSCANTTETSANILTDNVRTNLPSSSRATTTETNANIISNVIERTLPSSSNTSQRKRANNRELRHFVGEFGELQKRKIESEILANESKKKLYDAQTEYFLLKIECMKSQSNK